MGIGMMSSEAIVGGTFPDPEVAVDIPQTGWLWRWQGLATESPNEVRFLDYDIRTMRKVMYGSPVLVISNDPQVGTAFTVETVGLIRCQGYPATAAVYELPASNDLLSRILLRPLSR